ncbi:MAG: hypothetical protein AB7O26_16870 [Planctomycetaceae bacterium]
MTDDSESDPAADSSENHEICPLPRREQTRNILLFAACMGLLYLEAPITYVGVTQGPLCKNLGAREVISNLPGSLYMGMTIFPLFILWAWPRVSQLKTVMFWCYAISAVFTALVAVALSADVGSNIKIALVVAHAGLLGATGPTAVALGWEAIGRGVDSSRRGWALSMAFGAGPLLAALAGFGSQLILDGKLGSFEPGALGFPLNFVALYAAVAPMMLLAAYLATRFVVPLPAVDTEREPFIEGIFGGLWKFLSNPLLLTTTIVIILVYNGNAISTNMSLFSSELLEGSAEQYAGISNAARFGIKSFAGVLMGWLVMRTNPRLGLIATSSLFVLGQLWAIFVEGPWYLFAFGIFGMGELVGVYAPNYILAASRKSEIRRNQSFHTLMMMPASAAGLLFGAIVETLGGEQNKAFGFRASFTICAALILSGILLALWKLPANPRPTEEG